MAVDAGQMLPILALTVWCSWLSIVDIRERRLPNVLTVPGATAIIGYGTVVGAGRTALIGALLLAGPYLVLHVIAPSSMGAGDVKLAVGLGAAAALGGPESWVMAALLAPLGTAIVGAAVLVTRGQQAANTTLPHGAFMCAATLTALCAST